MRRLAAAALGAGITTSVIGAIRSLAPQAPRLLRTNYAGRTVTLAGGLGTAAGTVAAAIGAGGKEGTAAAVACASSGIAGIIDDQDTEAADKGFKGHLKALSQGRLTTGGAKLIGISATAVLAAAIGTGAGARGREEAPNAVIRAVDVLASGALIAGTANLHNLFDLRPGRALKVAAVLSAPLALSRTPGAPLAGGALGVIAGSAQQDLAEETMLGDGGANALGALVGAAVALHPNAAVRATALAGVVGLTALSEKVSFSRVITTTPVLRSLDDWGRTG